MNRSFGLHCFLSLVPSLLWISQGAGCTTTKDLSSDDTEGSSSMSGSASTQDGTTANDGSASMSSSNATSDGTTDASTTGNANTTGDASATGDGSSTGAAGSCDPFPEEGQSCSEPGTFCSTGDCADQCQFCNLLSCEDGTWQAVEVFPADCLDCQQTCDLVVAAECPGGPPDAQTCIAGCEELMASDCAIEFSDARACSGSEPTFTCNEATAPEVVGCEDEYDTLYACMAG